VTLTVTDNQGATGTVEHDVTVSSVVVYASDGFTRNMTSKWGSADTGGAWTLTNSNLYSVNGSAGVVNLSAPGTGATAFLNAISQSDVNVSVDNSLNQAPTGSGAYVTLVARHNGKYEYRLKERITSTGLVNLSISKVVNGAETTIRAVNISGLTYNAGDVLSLRFVVSGTSPTTLAGTVWKAGTTEPSSPQISLTDTESSLQSAGSVGFFFYLGASATAPVVVAVDNLKAVKPQ
jgi:hypothetical protein